MAASAWLWERMTDHLDRGALKTEQAACTYRQVLADAERIALQLRDHLGTQGAVLVLAPRAVPDTVRLLLGLWRCGLTPVLADAATPDARVEELLASLPPVGVLNPKRPDEPAGTDDVLAGDLVWQVRRCDVATRFPYGCPDPAYVIATSGSTGKPKMVLCRHSGLAHTADVLASRYGYGPDSRVLQFAPASYDAMIADVVVPLSVGSTLVFGRLGEPPSPERISELIAAARVTHVTLPPTVLRHLTMLEAPECTIVSAGEALDGALADWLLDRCRRLINAYGPCEATIAATAFDVVAPAPDAVPIGAPLRGVEVTLDDIPDQRTDLHPHAGIISIGGPTVAWGYITADRLASPSSPGFSENARFLTGDLAWRTKAGQLVFLSRIDRQIKRWGHRVEPGGIERRLRTIPGVTDCAVVPDSGRLHAFVVSEQTEDELAADAGRLLARHEQPTNWHVVDRLPALSSDKTNVAALMDTAASAARADTEPAAPTVTAGLDPRLVTLWERFVGPVVEPDTDLFASGADSMAVVLLLAAINEQFGVSIDLTEFLACPTLTALDARVGS
jgi:non-ribosomal peptide synthetase component F/acyl carrier protein